jgi:hypothetical protein
MGVGIVVYPCYIKPRFKDYQQKYRKDKSASPKRLQSVYTMKATQVTAGKGSQKPAGIGTLNRTIAAL